MLPPADLPHSPNSPVLCFRSVGVRFGATAALRDVSLDIRPHERVAIVGSSGSGKTTLLGVVSGLRRPTDGALVRAPGLRVGMLLQDPVGSLDPAWPVEQIVGEPLRDVRPRPSPGQIRDAVRRALVAVRLAGVDPGRRPRELSVGQCQRVALARALVARPDLILADEPTSALDPSVAAGVLRLLDEALTSTGAALLAVTHDVLAVAPLVDRVVVLHEGQIVEQCPPADLLAAPRHPAAVRLVEAAQQLAFAAKAATA